ncbi:MAG: membrane protein insertion efficiency factor YidD [Nitrospirae bacterium]|nr:membrane protein insertion efficiency factor YidD [Nitrospirota bacterium]
MRRLMIRLILFYQWGVSPLLPKACRFAPTCSCYAIESIRRHGSVAGLRLTAIRLLKCQPFHPGGYDPVR